MTENNSGQHDQESQQSGSQDQEKVSREKRQKAAEAFASTAKEREHQEGPLPKVDLNTFVLSLSSSVLVQLGEVCDPNSGQTCQNLDIARHTIDILGMLEQKTRGNLTPDEETLLKNVLFELRMKYVQKAR